jgi:hypothetical protein
MNSRLVATLALGCVLLADSASQAQRGGRRRGDWEAARNGWIFNLEQGKAEARKAGKPLMVVLRCVP